MPETISRTAAERRITEYQLKLLAEHNCSSTWELYALLGIGHCCGGPYSRSDTELHALYRECIPDIETLHDEKLVKAIIDFELSELKEGRITCQGVGLAHRICEGLGKYANQELPWLFQEALSGVTVVDEKSWKGG